MSFNKEGPLYRELRQVVRKTSRDSRRTCHDATYCNSKSYQWRRCSL